MKVKKVFTQAVEKLQGIVDTPRLDVKILLANFLNIGENDLIGHFNKEIDDKEFEKILSRRMKNEPVANIIERKSFWDKEFYVNKNVLTPRPDSETFIDAMLDNYKDMNEKLNILDLGTGSGCLLLTLLDLYKNANGIGVDISEEALQVAKINGNGIKNVKFVKGNWNDDIEEKFDIVISNPPYIPTKEIEKLTPEVKVYNPILALNGGKDGLDCYRHLAKNLKKNLNDGGRIFIEIGWKQEKDVIEIFKEYIFMKMYKDFGGVNRILSWSV
jgi:release factor glutamine methyltransferase